MTLDESVDEESDILKEFGSLKFVYEKGIALHLEDKIVDYQTAPNEGFAIYSGNGQEGCGGSDCQPSGGCGDGCCH